MTIITVTLKLAERSGYLSLITAVLEKQQQQQKKKQKKHQNKLKMKTDEINVENNMNVKSGKIIEYIHIFRSILFVFFISCPVVYPTFI